MGFFGLTASASKWLGFLGAFLTLILGFIHIFTIGAKIKWPQGDEYMVVDDGVNLLFKESFMADSQKYTWRGELFSLTPDKLLDIWPPVAIGTMGMLCHLRSANKLKCLTRSFFNYFWFLMFMGLFGTIAYQGALGIIFSIPVFVAAGLAAIMLLFDEQEASLNLVYAPPTTAAV